MSFKKILPYLAIFVATTAIIFYQFPAIPQHLSFDELEFARLALSLEHNPVVYSPLATGHTTPYYFFILGAFKLLGVSAFSLRFPAALFGVFNGIVAYALFRKIFKNTSVALLTVFTFVSMRWVFQFARFSFEVTYLLFWEMTAVYFTLHYLETHKKRFLVFVLISSVVSFYSYLPGRIFFLVPLVYLLIKKTPIKYLIVMTITFLLFALPLIQISGKVESRVSTLSFLSDKKLSSTKKVELFTQNVGKVGGMFFLRGDLNGRHNYPGKAALNPILFGLFIIGMWYAFRQKNRYTRIMLLWLFVSLAPSLFTQEIENPHFLRTYNAVVPVSFFIGIVIQKIVKLKKTLLTTFLIAILLCSAAYELRTYFYFQTQVFPEAFEYELDAVKKIPNEKLQETINKKQTKFR